MAVREQFEFGKDHALGDVDVTELRAVLDELHRDLGPELEQDHTKITLDELVEATGMPMAKVVEAVQRVREARMSEVIRELEASMYRVERAGHAPADPMLSQRFARREHFSDLLDRQAKPKVRQDRKPTVHERVTDHLATVVAALVVLAVLAFLLVLVFRGLFA